MNIYYVNLKAEFKDKALEAKYLKDKADKLLRHVLLLETGQDILNYKKEYTVHGKPYFNEIKRHFNISHTKNMVACVTGESPVGIDCQCFRKVNDKTARKVLTKKEYDEYEKAAFKEDYFANVWSFKEAFVKFLGSGIRYSLNSISLLGENSVFALFEDMKVVSKKFDNIYLTAIQDKACKVKIINVDLLS